MRRPARAAPRTPRGMTRASAVIGLRPTRSSSTRQPAAQRALEQDRADDRQGPEVRDVKRRIDGRQGAEDQLARQRDALEEWRRVGNRSHELWQLFDGEERAGEQKERCDPEAEQEIELGAVTEG